MSEKKLEQYRDFLKAPKVALDEEPKAGIDVEPGYASGYAFSTAAFGSGDSVFTWDGDTNTYIRRD